MVNKDRLESEISALEEALQTLEAAMEGLKLVLRHVARGAREAAEKPLMPHYERAEEQLRVALNAAAGATKSIQRRLDMRRRLRAARPRRGSAGRRSG